MCHKGGHPVWITFRLRHILYLKLKIWKLFAIKYRGVNEMIEYFTLQWSPTAKVLNVAESFDFPLIVIIDMCRGKWLFEWTWDVPVLVVRLFLLGANFQTPARVLSHSLAHTERKRKREEWDVSGLEKRISGSPHAAPVWLGNNHCDTLVTSCSSHADHARLSYLTVVVFFSRFLISWPGILCGSRGGWCPHVQSPREGNNWAICGQEGELRTAFVMAAVGGRRVRSTDRVWRLCACVWENWCRCRAH